MSTAAELEAEVARLRDGLDTLDWLLHVDRRGEPAKLTRGEAVKRDAVELIRALLGVSYLEARGIPL